jgi:hypothetical protein
MQEQLPDVPAWVRTIQLPRIARGTTPPPAFARGSATSFDDVDVTVVTPMLYRAPRRVGRWLVLASFLAVAASVTVAGARMWQHRVAPVIVPSAVVAAGDGRLELSPERRAIARVAEQGTRWTAQESAPIDSMQIAGPLVLARTSSAFSAIDLETGNRRFAWALPASERWSPQSPAALGSCLFTVTVRGEDALARCLELTTGAARWTAKIAGGRECMQPALAVPGAYLLQCPGWTSVIDDKNGAVTVEAGGIGLVQNEPAMLLRGGARPNIGAWSDSARRFQLGATTVRGLADPASSAVLHQGRLVVRASSASDKVALVIPKTGAPIAISVPEMQLSDDTGLVLDCGTGASPRFQLLELAPRVGQTFDPAAAQRRVLALLDVEAGRLVWTSHAFVPTRHAGAPATMICKHGHYFVPVDLHGGDANAATSALLVLDAETGATSRTAAFDPGAETSFADLSADQIDADRIVGVGRAGTFVLPWRDASVKLAGLRDARADLERELGRLP